MTGGPGEYFASTSRPAAPTEQLLAAPPVSSSQLVTRRRRPTRSQIGIAAIVVIAVVIGLDIVGRRTRAAAALGQGDGTFGRVIAHPPSRTFVDPQRILPAPVAASDAGGYTVLRTHNGQPVTWDPCQPIHFVVRPDGAPPGGQLLLDKAIGEISKDTGLFFMDDGTTTEAPAPDRRPYQPDRYGTQWAPVLIAWSSSGEFPELQGDVVGRGGPITIDGKNARNVSGEVVFDASDITQIEATPDGATFAYDIMLHELGHLVGLGHVNDPTQIMNAVSLRPLPGYGSGDLRGLAALGAGRCFTTG